MFTAAHRSLALASAGLLVGLLACNKLPKGGDQPAVAEAASPAAPASDPEAGRAVFAAQNCGMCHGEDGAGSGGAPALSDLKANWDRQKLAQYLKDPQGFAEQDPRLAANQGKYAIPMPAFALSPEDEGALIDFLLSR